MCRLRLALQASMQPASTASTERGGGGAATERPLLVGRERLSAAAGLPRNVFSNDWHVATSVCSALKASSMPQPANNGVWRRRSH